MKKNDSIQGLIIGFSIGLVLAFLTTPTKGFLYVPNKKRSFHMLSSSLYRTFESILTMGLCEKEDGSVKRGEK
jgi:gas vesicle protein